MASFELEKEALMRAMDTGDAERHFLNSPSDLQNDPDIAIKAIDILGEDAITYLADGALVSSPKVLSYALDKVGEVTMAYMGDEVLSSPTVYFNIRKLGFDPEEYGAKLSKENWADIAEAYEKMEHIFAHRQEVSTRPADSKIGTPQYEGELFATGKAPQVG